MATLEDGKMITEASTLGWPAGLWPDLVAVVNKAGEGNLYRKSRVVTTKDGEISHAIYLPRNGAVEFLVFND
jgi:hypothetical protein